MQILRGLAALLVLVGHVQGNVENAATELGVKPTLIPHLIGGFGVDLFFAISGFIMVISSHRLFGSTVSWHQFLVRRTIRLAPLYWILTILYALMFFMRRSELEGSMPAALLSSLFFIPHMTQVGSDRGVFPIYSLGWSLNYEMLFYVIFSAFLFLPARRAVLGTIATLLLLVLAGEVFQPTSDLLSFWTSPIMIEFGFGLMLGMAWSSALRIPGWVCIIVGLLSVVLLFNGPSSLLVKAPSGSTPNDFYRLFGWGIPAVGILFAGVFWEKGRPFRKGPVLWSFEQLGNASYSLYMIQPMVILFVIKGWKILSTRIDLALFAGWLGLGLLTLVTVVAGSFLLHFYVEKPLTNWLNSAILRRAT